MNRRGFIGYLAGLAAFLPWVRGKVIDSIPTEVVESSYLQWNPPGSFKVTTQTNSDFLTEIITEGTTRADEFGNYPQQNKLKLGFLRVSGWFKEDVFDKTLEYKFVDREIPKPNKADQ